MFKKLGSKGFTALEVILIVILLSGISAAGYFVYKNSDKDKETKASKNTVQVDKQQQKESVSTAQKEAELKDYLINLCHEDQVYTIRVDQLFDNRANQTVETDNLMTEGNYAIVNYTDSCTLANQNVLNTLFLKYSNKWSLVVDKPVGVDCDFLSQKGFPKDLRVPYCQNTMLPEGQ